MPRLINEDDYGEEITHDFDVVIVVFLYIFSKTVNN